MLKTYIKPVTQTSAVSRGVSTNKVSMKLRRSMSRTMTTTDRVRPMAKTPSANMISSISAKIMWALDKKIPMPTEDDLKELPVEHAPKKEKEEEEAEENVETKKMFPFMLRITPLNTKVDTKNGGDIEIRLKK